MALPRVELTPAGMTRFAKSIMNPPREPLEAVVAHLSGRTLEEVRANRLPRSRTATRATLRLGKLWTAESVRSPQGSWESLAAGGFIPFSWVGAAEREFLTRQRTAERFPSSARLMIALASDPRGVSTAEALAREVADRVYPGHGGLSWVFQWRCSMAVERSKLELTGSKVEFAPELAALARAVRRIAGSVYRAHFPELQAQWYTLWPSFVQAAPTDLTLGYSISDDLWDSLAWGHCGARSLCHDRLEFATAADPFAALLGVWATGYALETLVPGKIGLVAPIL